MLETCNLVWKYTHLCSFGILTFKYQDPVHFADVSIFFKNTSFFGRNSTSTQSNIMKAVFEIL